MAEAVLLNGLAMAAGVRGEVLERADAFAAVAQRRPGLAVVLVGENPASQVYVRSKLKFARELGFHSAAHRLSAGVGAGGVGPMTVAYLMANTCRAVYLRQGMSWDDTI